MSAPAPAVIRPATTGDMAAVRAIYAPEVMSGLASFEEIVPEIDELAARFQAVVRRRLPYLVLEHEGAVRGYAYASPYRPRSAYRFTLEDSVYIGQESQGRGYGRLLLSTLIEQCGALGYRQMVAIIGDSANDGSIILHERCGFVRVGTMTSIGFKLGQWVDSVLMQRALGPGDETPPNA